MCWHARINFGSLAIAEIWHAFEIAGDPIVRIKQMLSAFLA
jgi:hypothetical protein